VLILVPKKRRALRTDEEYHRKQRVRALRRDVFRHDPLALVGRGGASYVRQPAQPVWREAILPHISRFIRLHSRPKSAAA
jgi:hypothetical protein